MRTNNRTFHLSFALLVGLAISIGSTTADAKTKRPKYVYLVSKVALAQDVKTAPISQIRAGLAKSIEAAPEIQSALPEKTPDPAKEPEQFKRFLKKKKLAAYRVNVEITSYELSTETHERGKRVAVRVELRLFGETMPDRVMSFAGNGSATVKLDVGKRVRPADEKAANAEAIELAIQDAVAASLAKLAKPKRKSKRSKK